MRLSSTDDAICFVKNRIGQLSRSRSAPTDLFGVDGFGARFISAFVTANSVDLTMQRSKMNGRNELNSDLLCLKIELPYGRRNHCNDKCFWSR